MEPESGGPGPPLNKLPDEHTYITTNNIIAARANTTNQNYPTNPGLLCSATNNTEMEHTDNSMEKCDATPVIGTKRQGDTLSRNKSKIHVSESSVKHNNDSSSTNRQKYLENTSRNRYKSTDKGPYYVNVEGNTGNIGKIHRMSFGKWVFQSTYNFKKDIVDISNTGQNRLKIETKTPTAANNILNLDIFKEKDVIAYIPNYLVNTTGVIRGVDRDLDEQEILTVMQSSVTPKFVKRITKRVHTEDGKYVIEKLSTCIITFQSQVLPQYVSIYGARCYVEPYIPPLRQCRRCLRFRHSEDQCRSKPRCEICFGEHLSRDCKPTNDSPKPSCIHCSGEHTSTSRDCPVRSALTQKIKDNIVGKSFSEVTKNKFDLLSEIDSFPGLENEPATRPSMSKPKQIKNKNKMGNKFQVANKSKYTHTTDQITETTKEVVSVVTNQQNNTSTLNTNNNTCTPSISCAEAPEHEQHIGVVTAGPEGASRLDTNISYLLQLVHTIKNESQLMNNQLLNKIGGVLENILLECGRTATATLNKEHKGSRPSRQQHGKMQEDWGSASSDCNTC